VLVVLLGGFTAFAVLGACLFAGGILVTPLLALGGEGSAVPMAAVVAGGALAAWPATITLTGKRGHSLEPVGPRSRDERT
jgi:hypothetical protein